MFCLKIKNPKCSVWPHSAFLLRSKTTLPRVTPAMYHAQHFQNICSNFLGVIPYYVCRCTEFTRQAITKIQISFLKPCCRLNYLFLLFLVFSLIRLFLFFPGKTHLWRVSLPHMTQKLVRLCYQSSRNHPQVPLPMQFATKRALGKKQSTSK